MDKILKVGLLLLVLVMLTACGAKDAAGGETAGEETAEAAVSGSEESDTAENTREQLRDNFSENALPPATQLLLGTFMLEETEYAVDGELAPYLLPYWKLYSSLLESDTTAPEELAALIEEIQEVMYPEQVNYIADLELTQEDLMAFMNESGIMEDLRPDDADDGDSTRPGRPDGMPEGTGPGGGQGGGQGAEGVDMDPELMATMQARREEMGDGGGMGANRMVTPLIEALIELLESKGN